MVQFMFQNLTVSEKAISKYLYKYTEVLGNKITVMFTLGVGGLNTLKSSHYEKEQHCVECFYFKGLALKTESME